MTDFWTSELQNTIEEQEEGLRQALSTFMTVTLIDKTYADCSGCPTNPVYGDAENINCSICGGSGKIVTETEYQLEASVYTDDSVTTRIPISAGTFNDNIYKVDISYGDYTTYQTKLNTTNQLDINGVRYKIIKVKLAGIYSKTTVELFVGREEV